jgi:HKD family nuclease
MRGYLCRVSLFVPSSEVPDGRAALQRLIADAVSISVAVAFVTDSGVEALSQLLGPSQVVELEVCARGAPITQQSALLTLRERLGARVTVVMGEQAHGFHPKLWLVRSATQLSVMSGSGNLTFGGLVSNVEQYEILQEHVDSEAAAEHEHRFAAITSAAIPLEEAEVSPAWYEWTNQLKKRAQIQRQLRELDTGLASQKSGGRAQDKRQLCDDLNALYEQTVSAKLPGRDGKPYRWKRWLALAPARWLEVAPPGVGCCWC